MMRIRDLCRRGGPARLAALALLLALVAGPAAEAQQVNPTAESVREEALLEALRAEGGEAIGGRVSLPNEAAGVLIKPGGRDWSNLHQGTMYAVTLWSLVGMVVLLALFFLIRGRIRIEAGRAGRTILRFNGLERFAHWLTAVSFIVLALTGLNLVLGRHVLLPLVGESAFGTVSAWAKLAHNYVGWPFMLGVLLVFLIWVRDNLPSRIDAAWLAQGGGLFSKGVHPPARRFNAGQKIIFWAVVIGGVALSWTGILLLFPDLAGSPGAWQTAQMIHGLVAAVMTAIILAHIYLGSIGMEGAFDAMGSGEVDLNWAREHHALWVEEELGRAAGKTAQGGPAAGRPVAPAE